MYQNQNRNPHRLFFDIETIASPAACALMPDPKPPANFKDPEKIAAAIAEKKAEQLDMAALDPDYGTVISIGISYGEEVNVWAVGQTGTYNTHPVTEADLLIGFWDHLASVNGRCVGYNILSFDLPYLLRRSMALNIRPPLLPVLAKFRTEPVTDLMSILYNWGSDRYKSLKQVCRLYGIPNDIPDVDGSKVKDLTLNALIEYQASDVRLVIQLYERMKGVYF